MWTLLRHFVCKFTNHWSFLDVHRKRNEVYMTKISITSFIITFQFCPSLYSFYAQLLVWNLMLTLINRFIFITCVSYKKLHAVRLYRVDMSGIEIIYTRLSIHIAILPKGISEKCLPQSSFPQYIPFFRQNIWYSIFDRLQFHYIIGRNDTIIKQTGKGTSAVGGQ